MRAEVSALAVWAVVSTLCRSKRPEFSFTPVRPASGLNGKGFPQLGCLVATSVPHDASGRRQM